jgi:hypothetical protein
MKNATHFTAWSDQVTRNDALPIGRESFCGPTKRSPSTRALIGWASTVRPFSTGESDFWTADWMASQSVCKTCPALDALQFFPPQEVAAAKAVACERPAVLELPLSRFSTAEIRQWMLDERVVTAVSLATVWRWLHQDAIRPWFYHAWLFPRDPQFLEKAGPVLDLYHRLWQNEPLGPNDYVISADEKSQLQALGRSALTLAPLANKEGLFEFEYIRGGTVAYLAALDVFSGQIFGRVDTTTGIVPFNELVHLVMQREPYTSANRVFWIVDNGSSHHPSTFPARLQSLYPNATAVMLPVHASWLNQIELYFSILQRKALTPNDLATPAAMAERILGFENRYNRNAKPFHWKFTRAALEERMQRLEAA